MFEFDTSLSLYVIAILFFIIAFAYSSVGLGGGSSYTALMAILGVNVVAIPLISLLLNLLVTTIGSVNFIRKKHARLNLILPFILSSIPMAYVGGSLDLPKHVFYWILLATLVFVAVRIYLWKDTSLRVDLDKKQKLVISLITGSVLGLVAGIVGIGGGIYLVPLIIILGLGSTKEAAACGLIFVWVNSASGLVSRLQYNYINPLDYLPLIVAVIAGGTAGSFMGSTRFKPALMEKILGIIILVAIGFLAKRLLFP